MCLAFEIIKKFQSRSLGIMIYDHLLPLSAVLNDILIFAS